MKKHKKILSVALAVMSFSMCILPTTAFATNKNETTEIYYSMEETVAYAEYEENSMARATGLITAKNLYISKNGTTLSINGYTVGNSETEKVGFKEVIIERRKNSSSSWSEYKVYKDLYSSSAKYTLSKSITVPSGYQYRVTAVHYAKKSLFSTQKITATTGYLTF